MRTCKQCNQEKTLDEFYTYKKPGNKIFHKSTCKECDRERSKSNRQRINADPILLAQKREKQFGRRERHNTTAREWYKNNPDAVRRKRWKSYGVDPDIADSVYFASNGHCDICSQPSDNLHLDHCHTTFKVRGMLCPNCNHLLGKAKDSQRILVAAIDYLNNRN